MTDCKQVKRAYSSVQLLDYTLNEAMHNLSAAHYLSQYYQPQRVPNHGKTASVSWCMHRKLARGEKLQIF